MTAPIPPKNKRVISLRPKLQQAAEASLKSKETIDLIMRRTRAPFDGHHQMATDEIDSLEKSLRRLEADLLERERNAADYEAKLSERERDIWEGEALLKVKQEMLAAKMSEFNKSKLEAGSTDGSAAVSEEERVALEHLRETLEQREAALQQMKDQLKEREAFVEESENALFEKMMEQQETETELEQRSEELRSLERRIKDA
ncbi:hypothetical protein [Cerasicoccus arenae]|uniref:Uncharacterized protein n=2 Tax=Cerasicoccus arenae TaxID=424488 RepID=A0A8J3DEF0_9BACT|nr:hypothetical protein [Cerasicoccus arenae]GHC10516.1 hypothetical protein GCM10007047_29860 [Cerasicoccus arenae]